jgi:RNA-directed DNA polymerase
MSTQIDRICELAKEDPKRQFFSIAHLITPEALYEDFRGLRKKASAGVDGVTYQKYEKDAARKIQQLHERLKESEYRAQPLRRIYIPKEKWEGTTYLHTILGGQNRAEGDGRSAKRHL